MKTEQEKKEIVESAALAYPIGEYCFGDVSRIPFSDKVRYICETDCERYGHSWACPPYCGTVCENIDKCRRYSHFLLFSTVAEVENAWDKEVCLRAKSSHEEISRELRAELREKLDDFYVLSTGCTICEKCACPEEPCRHPEERLSSMESHGIVIMQLAEETGLCYCYGGDTIVYFSIILF